MTRIIYLGGLGDDSADLSHHLASRHETGTDSAIGSTIGKAALLFAVLHDRNPFLASDTADPPAAQASMSTG